MATPEQFAGSRRIILREAARLARLDAARLGQELRELRLGLGVHQAEVARAVGVSRSVISELEAGDPTVGLEIRRRAAVALGADLRINVYRGATPLLHDVAHARVIERILARRHPCWRAQIETRVPGPDGRRQTSGSRRSGRSSTTKWRPVSERGMPSSGAAWRSENGSVTGSAVGWPSTRSCVCRRHGIIACWSRHSARR